MLLWEKAYTYANGQWQGAIGGHVYVTYRKPE